MKKKEVEWKETRPEYTKKWTYSLLVRNRCIFFGSESPRRWKKALNFAAKFASPNKICILIVFGMPRGGIKSVKNALQTFPGNVVCVIYDGVTDDDFMVLDEHAAYKQKMLSAGLMSREGKLSENYHKEREQLYRLVSDGILSEDEPLYQKYKDEDKIMKRYGETIKKLENIQEQPAKSTSNFSKRNKVKIDESGIVELIRELYPYGLEADTRMEEAAKITNANKYIKFAMQGDYTQLGISIRGLERQYSMFDIFTVGASEIVEAAERYCKFQERKEGCFWIMAVWSLLEKPPFGAYECNWYLYLFAIAMRKYFSDEYRWLIGVATEKGANCAPEVLLKRKAGIVFGEDKNRSRLAKLICELFDVPEIRKYYRENAHESIHDALMAARRWCEENIQTPLAWIDQRFYTLLDCDREKWCRNGEADQYLRWLEEKGVDLYNQIRTIDVDFDESVIPIYGKKRVSLWRKYQYVKGGAVGWSHSKEMFVEGLETYMKKMIVCRECGRVIADYRFKNGGIYQTFTEFPDGQELIFTANDIIGVNKKFIGRYQEEYFCVPCLCKVLDITEERLHERINDFKEEGCALFF